MFFKRYVIYLLINVFFIIRDEFEFNDLDYCVLISVLNLNMPFHKSQPIQGIDEAVTKELEHLFEQQQIVKEKKEKEK